KLKDYLPLLKERLESCNNLDGFLSDLRTLIDNVIDHTPVNHFPKYYDVICKDLEDIGWEKIKSISPQFRKIELEFKDANERTHILRINVTDNYPQESPEISTELPCPFIPLWVPGGSLLSVCEQFTTSLEMYQYLWDSVDELKRECWILEPEHPNYSCTSLRISLGKNCSLKIQVNPLQPDELPECHFLGSNSVVAKLQAKYQQGYEDWSENLSILQVGLFFVLFPEVLK
uniref:FANCL UBC-like domain-containing protein n=1 Tax=Ciona savignyi TaxID=51511 RepID=H2Z1S3_CIOSA